MRFVEAYGYWKKRSFTQEEAARLLGVSDRTFRRYFNRYIEMIPSYSPEARGRVERAFGTHQERLTKELALNEITDIVNSEEINDIVLQENI